MLKKHIRSNNGRSFELRPLSVSFAVLFIVLLCGIVAGCMAASHMSIETKSTVNEYISSFVTEIVSSADHKSGLIELTLSLIMYPLIIFCMGYTAFGILGIPAVVCVKGFLISFSVSSVFKVLGYKGMALALAVYGLQAMILLPCIILTAVFSMNISIGILKSICTSDLKKNVCIPHKRYFLIFSICITAVVLISIIDAFCSPVLVELASEIIM